MLKFRTGFKGIYYKLFAIIIWSYCCILLICSLVYMFKRQSHNQVVPGSSPGGTTLQTPCLQGVCRFISFSFSIFEQRKTLLFELKLQLKCNAIL